MSEARFVLDAGGDGLYPPDATVLQSERDFLELAAKAEVPEGVFVVRGKSLCRWVEDWCAGRGLANSISESPRALWRHIHGAWTNEEIEMMQIQSGYIAPPSTLDSILEAVYPDGPWQEAPGVEHAARWALWLTIAQVTPQLPTYPLLRLQVERWQDAVDMIPVCHHAYGLHTGESAQFFLDEWVIQGQVDGQDCPVFPLVASSLLQRRAQELWRFQLIREEASSVWLTIAQRNLSKPMRQAAAQTICEYLLVHPDKITPELLKELKPYLSLSDFQGLQERRPPTSPETLLPGMTPEAVLTWFDSQYLPFRQWQSRYGEANHYEHVENAARSFVEWLLDFYPQAIGGGKGNAILTITTAAQLYQNRQTSSRQKVTLWIILDGMPVPDGEHLRDLLQADEMLTVGEYHLCFAPLPTITCFAKPALMNGRSPQHFEITETPIPQEGGAILLRDKTMRQTVQEARPGQVLVFSHKNPDAIYHRNQSPETTASEVDGTLIMLAEQIRDLSRLVPKELELTIVVSTDHGRLLSQAVPRLHPLPPGSKSEGRAAWAESVVFTESAQENGSTFYSPSDGVIELVAEPFGLPARLRVWVARDGSAFVQSNGSSGTVAFPHGGLWPEEVIVPWFTMVRNAQLPSVQIHITGKGVAGGAGVLVVNIENAENDSLMLRTLSLYTADNSWQWQQQIDKPLLPLKRTEFEQKADDWLRSAGLRTVTGIAQVQLSSGVVFDMPVDAVLETDALYQNSLGAGDLLEL